MIRTVLVLAVPALILLGCGSEAASSPPRAGTETSAEGLPGPVSETRSAIVAAAEAGDYERLRPVLEQDVFLSDYGFGNEQPDPVGRWHEVGPEPLETMDVLLHMPHVVRETNEGTLYQWPRFNPDSKPEDLTPAERDLFLAFMSEDELRQAFNPDLGYTAPRLGILADGTWWFFVTEQG